MKRKVNVLLWTFLIFSLTIAIAIPNFADAFYPFRCGTKLVRVGDTKTDILNKCGSPTMQNPGRIGTGGVDVWVYNQGSSKTIKILRFTGPKLTSIESSSTYGYSGS
jgi:hypothetical protein